MKASGPLWRPGVLVVAAGVAAVLVVAAGVAAVPVAAEIGPAPAGTYAFAAAVDTAPLKAREVAVVDPGCKQGISLPLDCAVKVAVNTTGRPVTGSVSEPTRGIKGAYAASCDLAAKATADVHVSGAGIEIKSLESSFGTQKCTWEAAFDNGGKLSGTLTAPSIGLTAFGGASPFVNILAALRVDVFGGSGAFAGAGGTGTFSQLLRMPLPLSVLDGALDRALTSVLGSAAGFVTSLPLTFAPPTSSPPAATPSPFGIKIVKALPKVEILAPLGTARRADALRVASAPGATCTASAIRHHGWNRRVTVDFGKASDTAKKGLVTWSRPFAKLVARTTWNVTVTCDSRSTSRQLRITG